MAFNQRSLSTPGQSEEQKLMRQQGVDMLQSGGFAQRDAIRQQLSEDAQGIKRKSRAANLAYRQAIRQGDRKGALGILLESDRQGIEFGGVRAAGRDRQQAAQRIGEEYSTLKDAEEQQEQEPVIEEAEAGTQLLADRKDLARKMGRAKSSGSYDKQELRDEARGLGISREAASTLWGSLDGPAKKRTAKEVVADAKEARGAMKGVPSNELPNDRALRLIREREDYLLKRSRTA